MAKRSARVEGELKRKLGGGAGGRPAPAEAGLRRAN